MLPNLSLSGWMRSGKDTIASFLVNEYGYTKLSFAGALKAEVARGVGCRPEELDEEPLHTQIRPVLQAWSTEFRRGQDSDYWVKQALMAVVAIGNDPIVFTDTRFVNELEALRGKRFTTVEVRMSQLDVERALFAAGKTEEEVESMLSHPSERDWQRWRFDKTVLSIPSQIRLLTNQIEEVIEEVQARAG